MVQRDPRLIGFVEEVLIRGIAAEPARFADESRVDAAVSAGFRAALNGEPPPRGFPSA